MVINIIEPPVGLPFGPGFNFRFTASGFPTQPPDTHWNYRVVLQSDEDNVIWHMRQPFTGNGDIFSSLSYGPEFFPQVLVPRPEFPEGVATRFLITLETPTGVVTSLSQAQVWEGLQGQAATATQYLLATMPASGGLTALQARQLQTVWGWAIWALVGELLPELVQELLNRLRTAPDRRQIDPDRSGIGEINPPDIGPFFKWVGIEWQVFGLAPGFGTDEGNPDTTEVNWGQLTRVDDMPSGPSVATETFYEARLGAAWVWGLDQPERVLYYIQPGVVVRFWWLIQLEPVQAQQEQGHGHQVPGIV